MPTETLNLFDGPLPLGNDDPAHECHECGTLHAGADSREHDGHQYCPDCMHCPECGNVFVRENGCEHDSELYCDDCVHTCEECDTTTLDSNDLRQAYTSEHRRRSDTSYVCAGCRWQCADCNGWFINGCDQGTNANDETICTRCEEEYTCCEDCNTIMHNDDAHYHESREVNLCNSCYVDATRDDDSIIHEYGYHPSPKFNFAPNQNAQGGHLLLGWEIEVDRRSPADCRTDDLRAAGLDESDIIYCKEDGSLDYGFEMVSHPGTWEYWRAFDWNFAPELANLGYRSFDHTNTGMHVHVSKSFLSEVERYKLLLFVRSNSRLIFTLSRRRTVEAMSSYAAIDCGRKSALLRKAKKGPTARYEAINLLPKHTVEFRFFRGTLKPASIKRNLALVATMCHFVKHTSPGKVSAADFLAYLEGFGASVVGADDAADLTKWVRGAVETNDCEPDTKF